MIKILLLGPQGSGKGTQAVRLSQKLGIPALSMGQLLRDEVASQSELGTLIQGFINRGELVPDGIALDVLKVRLAKPDAVLGYILDGYPRNRAQYKTFETFDVPTAVIVLNVPREESLKRLMRRAEIEGRSDDTPELINRRLEIYENDTEPVIAEYAKKELVHMIDGIGEMEDVEKRIDLALHLA
jgi:adenylate kinase